MFKRQAITDERILNAQNQIYRELYYIVLTICIISMVVKTILGVDGFQHVVAEILILLAGGLYYLIRAARMGIYSEEVELKNAGSKWSSDKKYTVQSIIVVVVMGVVLGIAFGLNSALNYADSTAEAVKFFVLVFITTIMMYAPVMFLVLFVPHMLAKKKSEHVNERMLEQEDDE